MSDSWAAETTLNLDQSPRPSFPTVDTAPTLIYSMHFLPLGILASVLCQSSHAARVNFTGKSVYGPHFSSLSRRAYAGRRASNDTIAVTNNYNSQYIAPITLNGKEVPVLLDTGSSDLWVTGNIPNAVDTGKSLSLSYAVGTTRGDIHTAELGFDGYTIDKQAFRKCSWLILVVSNLLVLVNDTSSFSSNISASGLHFEPPRESVLTAVVGYNGLIGLGPASGSKINDKIDDLPGARMSSNICTFATDLGSHDGSYICT